jgi:amidase
MPVDSDPIALLDATAQAERVRRGETTPAELVEASIARIERVNPQLNAVIHPLYEKARQAAGGALPDGPFRGVPLLVKDAVCHTAGDPYHVGMRFLKEREWVAKTDTELARRFRAAGFVIVGKTNTPELAMSVTTEPLAYGATRNPWDPSLSPGGSSGGSAAAVAAGLAPVGHANDMGGSIRIPSAFCGLVGLKPTRARGSLGPELGEYWGPLTHEHVVTRTVRDCAGVLDAVAGPAVGDPYAAPAPVRPWLAELDAAPAALRIGFVARTSIADVDPACAEAVERTAALLGELGHRVEQARIPALGDIQAGPWIAAGLARELDRWSELTGAPIGPDDVEPMNWLMAEQGRALSVSDYIASAERAHAWSRELQQWWATEGDVLLTPTTAKLTPRLGECSPEVPLEELLPRMGQTTPFTLPFDVTGQPAISLPLHESESGLPIGVQLVAATGREDLLFRLATQLEAAAPWTGRTPRIHA